MSQSTDRKVTTDLIQTLEDGKKGFAEVADKLTDSDRSEWAPRFADLSAQRAAFSQELERMAAAYGDDIDEQGSFAGTVHRGWINLKDAVTGSSPKSVLDAAVTGENHAVGEYEKALEADLSIDLRNTVERQYLVIKSAAADVASLRDAVS